MAALCGYVISALMSLLGMLSTSTDRNSSCWIRQAFCLCIFALMTFASLQSQDMVDLVHTGALWSLAAVVMGWPMRHTVLFLSVICASLITTSSLLLPDGELAAGWSRSMLFVILWLAGLAGALSFKALELAQEGVTAANQAYEMLLLKSCDFTMCVKLEPDGESMTILNSEKRSDSSFGKQIKHGMQLHEVIKPDQYSTVAQKLLAADEMVPFTVSATLANAGNIAGEYEDIVREVDFWIVRRPLGPEYFSRGKKKGSLFHIAAQFVNINLPTIQSGISDQQYPSPIPSPQDGPTPLQSNSSPSGGAQSVVSSYSAAIFDGSGETKLSSKTMKEISDLGHKEHWIVQNKHLQLNPKQLLGSGGFGLVCQGTYFGAAVAVKFARKKQPKEGKNTVLLQLQELRMLRYLRHPNIVLFYGACLDEEEMVPILVFEKVSGSTLNKHMEANPHAPEHFRIKIMQGIAEGISYLHSFSPAIVHGDLKAENIFVTSDTNAANGDAVFAKLGDFGLARRISKNSGRMGGSWHWVAPEIVQGDSKPHTSADIFSLGQVMYFIVSGKVPAAGIAQAVLAQKMREGSVPEVTWPTTFLSSQTRGIAEQCRLSVGRNRPNIALILQQLEKMAEYSPEEGPKRSTSLLSWSLLRNVRGVRGVAPDPEFTGIMTGDLEKAPMATPRECPATLLRMQIAAARKNALANVVGT
eukprot:CAMPEP_0197627202 /NCGR_PEP_ID=MMETSP1338-20131121/5876_1 /TAXON_ID=43686 ORGANISM="Pelagodinium beii, Strain RCC1491" /NCGR_SAMPLE_ID=MMETSP1338 /ASSEMBLY_ACC=CAM_ASM_000754 /LENGTH=697 /DNA_ID=CAMNT_0043197855 /DNA_START=209 /DNA_END=2302 /DNA_ORIENTATION=-